MRRLRNISIWRRADRPRNLERGGPSECRETEDGGSVCWTGRNLEVNLHMVRNWSASDTRYHYRLVIPLQDVPAIIEEMEKAADEIATLPDAHRMLRPLAVLLANVCTALPPGEKAGAEPG